MTDKEIQHFLNILLPDLDNQKRSKTANEKLSDDEKERLCVIAKELCSGKVLKEKRFKRVMENVAVVNPQCGLDYFQRFSDDLIKGFMEILYRIINILHSIGYNNNLTKTIRKDKNGCVILDSAGNPTFVASGYTNMPFLIKQVLYLFSVRMLQANYAVEEFYLSQRDRLKKIGKSREDIFKAFSLNQKDIFEELDKVFGIGHNILSDGLGQLTPDKYWRCIKYRQPENPLKYMGQKSDRLGVAIKHLVGQAEIQFKYDFFVDLFGGSSSAIVAPVYKKNVTYIYNDIDRLLKNYVEVMASETMCTKLIDEMLLVKDFIANGAGSDSYFDELEILIRDYIDNPIGKTKLNPNTKTTIKNIQETGEARVEYTDQECQDFLKRFQEYIVPNVKDEDLKLPFKDLFGNEIKYSVEILRQYTKTYQLLRHYPVIDYLTNKYAFCESRLLSHTEDGEKKTASYIEKEYRQYRALGILIENSNLYFNPKFSDSGFSSRKEKIQAARVLLIMHSFKVNLEIGSISSVILYLRKRGKNYRAIDKFCEKDFCFLIERYHAALKRVKLKNILKKGYDAVIKEYTFSKKKTLFYVDSPYVETTAYRTNERRWDIKNMRELIDALFASKQKFIFSMRACKETKGDRPKDQVKKTNEAIREVFSHFSHKEEEGEQELYVLAVDFDMDKLDNCIRECRQCEIMITNYPISNFYDIGWRESQTGEMEAIKIDSTFINTKEYKVKRFNEFIKIAEPALKSTL